MFDQLLQLASSGGTVSLIFAILLVFTWKYFTKDITRVRETGKAIIATKDALIKQKDEQLEAMRLEHNTATKNLHQEHQEHIKSLVRAHDEKIRAKDQELREQNNTLQQWLIKDVEVKAQMAQAVESLEKVITQIIQKS